MDVQAMFFECKPIKTSNDFYRLALVAKPENIYTFGRPFSSTLPAISPEIIRLTGDLYFQYFFFFIFSNIVDFTDVTVCYFLNIIRVAAQVILGDFTIFLEFF